MQASTRVLLLHDDQLADVAAMLSELDVAWGDGRSSQGVSERTDLVIGTPQHLLKWKAPGDPRAVARIALCDGGSRSMEKRLQAEGIDFVLRRPVHPTALRLLVQHMIYRGPERRRLRRVEAILPVRFRAGWRSYDAVLLEFSVGGCSLLTGHPPATDRRIKVFMAEELGLGGSGLDARVVRCSEAPEGRPGEHVVAVSFEEPSVDAQQRLAAAVAARAHRPAAPEAPPSRDERTTAQRPTNGGATVAERPVIDLVERRRLPRVEFTETVHGRVGGAPVVLMGSDLSPRGMQVQPESRLRIGLRLTLDLYGHGDIPPVRLEARVARDDGERGLFLEFVNLWPGASALIQRLIGKLPLLEPGAERGMVISEVVERR